MNIFSKTKNTLLSSNITRGGTVGTDNIDDLGKGVVSGDIILLPGEYVNFWTRITQDRAICARYMARIVVTLLNFEQDAAKAEKSLSNKSTVVSADHLIALLLNTVQFIDMFIGFDPKNEAFVSAMDKYEQAKKASPSFKNKNIADGLMGLSKRRAHRGQAAVKMIVECSTLDSAEEIFNAGLSLNTNSSPSSSSRPSSASFSSGAFDDFDGSALEKASVDYPFTFTCLTRMTKTDVSPKIFDELLKQLEGAGSALSSMAHMQGRTLALMFMLREFLTVSPTADHNWMQRACLVLMGLYKWPKPYGLVAKNLLDFIYLERRSPGCHLRERIIQENPSLHPSVSMKNFNITYSSAYCFDSEFENKIHVFSPPSRSCSTNFVFLDKSVPLCCTHKHIILHNGSTPSTSRSASSSSASSSKSSGKKSPTQESTDRIDELKQMRIDILSHAFDSDFVIYPATDSKSKNIVKDPLGLSLMEDKDLVLLYCEVLDILERAKSLPVKAGLGGESTDKDLYGMPYTIPGGLAKLYRESLLGSILERLHPGKAFAPRRSSDQKVKHVVRQSRRTSMIQQDNVTDRKSTVTEEADFDMESEEVNNARNQSKRMAQVPPPDNMSPLKEDSDDDDTETVDMNPPLNVDKPVFNASQNTIHDPVLFGQHAPHLPDTRMEVYNVKKKKCSVGNEASASIYNTDPTKEDYAFSTNDSGYLYIKQDVEDLKAVLEKAKDEWNSNFGHIESVEAFFPSDAKSSMGGSVSERGTSDNSSGLKVKVKVILMGSNMVIHRFLSSFVALYTSRDFDMSIYSLEIFVIPQGKNHLGIYLARADKWYRRHIFDAFKSSLGLCPQYSSARDISAFEAADLCMQNCLPVSHLRQLLHNYVRQASQKYPFDVFECLCWAAFDENSSESSKNNSNDASVNDMSVFNKQSTPDVIIPFVMQVQLGLMAQLDQFREKPASMSKLEKQNDKRLSVHSCHEKESLSIRESFSDKDAMFHPTDLSLQYLPSSITTRMDEVHNVKNPATASTVQVDTFATLSLKNFPIHQSSRDSFSKVKEAVTLPNDQLVMESQLCKGNFAELFNNRRKNSKAMDNFLEALHDKSTFEHPQHIGAIEINATNPGESFHILVDGTLFGPFRRLIIRSCTPDNGKAESSQNGNNEVVSIPIMSYMPLDQ